MEATDRLEGLLQTLDDRSTAIAHDEGRCLRRLIREHQCTRTIEVGFAYGFSAAYIMSEVTGAHIAIDPHPERYKDLGLANLKALGLADRLQLERDVAHAVLPRLLAEGRRFDFAFVDGDHKFDTTFVEFYYLDLLVDPGGIIVFHDAWMPSIQHVAGWIRTNRADYQFVRVPPANLIAVQKAGHDGRAWNHFMRFAPRLSMVDALRSRIRRPPRRPDPSGPGTGTAGFLE